MCGRLDVRVTEDDALYLRARDLRIETRTPTPAQQIPLVTREESTQAVWGWVKRDGKLYVHARAETAATVYPWSSAWLTSRGVVPVAGWWEGSWHVTGAGMHLAVLTRLSEHGLRVVVLTQEPGALGNRIERLPIPLTKQGTASWLAGGSLDDQVRSLTMVSEARNGPRQTSLFDDDVGTGR